jgi:glycolate dehydrogenase FAD-binding subunit
VTVDGVAPARVLDAEDVAHVQEVVRAQGPLVATGLGAHLDVGAPPRRLEVLLRLGGLSRVVDHQPGDMTVTVEAGCPLIALDRTLAAAGQWLPLDPPGVDGTTVGGLVAANLSGPLRASQGTARDLLLGLAVVGADGALVRSGGRVVKNVAGYDLPKLHVGALGTLGVIVEATFKVRPRPEVEEAVVLPAATSAEAAALALAVRDACDPFWLEAGSLEDGWGAVVGVAGVEADVAAARRTIAAVAGGGRDVRCVVDGAALRARLAAFPLGPAAAVLRAGVLPSDVGWAMERVAAVAGAVPVLSHVANGVVRARLDTAGLAASAVATLRPEVAARGGFLVVERAVPEVKRAVDVWGHPGEGAALMRGVKAAFDPAGIFAPGRFVGDL